MQVNQGELNFSMAHELLHTQEDRAAYDLSLSENKQEESFSMMDVKMRHINELNIN